MENVLYCKDLHDPIEGDNVKPSSLIDKEWDKMHRKPIHSWYKKFDSFIHGGSRVHKDRC